MAERRFGGGLRIVIVGLVITLVLAIAATWASIDATRTSARELERHSIQSEQRGFAVRHIERVEQLTGELEAALLAWMLEPEDRRIAFEVERLSRSLEDQALRLSQILPLSEQAHWMAIREPLRSVRTALARLRVSARSPAVSGVPADMHEQLDAPLANLRQALDQASDDLLNARASDLQRLDQQLTRAWESSAIAGLLFVLVVGGVWLMILRILMQRQRELDEAVAQIVQANEELDAFAGRTAHELRNVLNPASMAVQYLQGVATQSDADSRTLERLHRSFTRASAVIDALLAFSRAGRPTRGPTPVARVVYELVEAERERARELGVKLSVQADDVYVACDEGLVHTIIANLLGNALKFTTGRDDAAVELKVVAEGPEVLVRVADNGPGIPEADRPHVCEPFYRAGNTTASGAGIGLATVAKIARVHGGRVALEPNEPVGTRVCVWLPRAEFRQKIAATDRITA